MTLTAHDGSVAFATSTTAATTASPEPSPEPPVTANEFLPEDRDLSDCVGALERPGCGSDERGGPLLNLVFVLVIAGMAFIFWRIIIGVRKNRAELERTERLRTEQEPTEPEPTEPEPTEPEPTEPKPTGPIDP